MLLILNPGLSLPAGAKYKYTSTKQLPMVGYFLQCVDLFSWLVKYRNPLTHQLEF